MRAAARATEWVPIRWEMKDLGSLALLKGTPVNCLLLPWSKPDSGALKSLTAEARSASVSALALFTYPNGDVSDVRAALDSKVDGIVLEGDWPAGRAKAMRESIGAKLPIIELGTRAGMRFDSQDPVVGSYQGVWPGIHLIDDSGGAEASATGSNWIYTNSGFLKAARALTAMPIWMSVRPPPGTDISTTQYLQAMADCEMIGARWVLTLDAAFREKLQNRVPSALKRWAAMTRLLEFFEANRAWRSYAPFSPLTLLQSPRDGALLTGGVADMIGASHTPLRILPPDRLRAGSLAGTSVVINANPQRLGAAEREVLANYTKGGGMVFTAPAAWKKLTSRPNDRVILDHKDAKQLGNAWLDLEQIIRKHVLGVRLFNVPSILFNLVESADHQKLILELTSYADYPAENITIHLAGKWRQVTLLQPDKPAQRLTSYPVQEGTGIDIDQIDTVAVVQAEQ
ncbi:MAG TPA: hypothetical protein VGL97_10685 [Bryobacteraceae bacterium]